MTNKLTANQVRDMFLRFMESKWHKIIPSSPLIPENDPTTLFTGSWMQPMVPYLLWEKHPLWTRIADSQKCFRAQDIEEVWDNRHTTFFEMLWNWSLWDYFKEEQISFIFEFLTKHLNLDPDKLYVSVYRWNKELWINKDLEAVWLWQEEFKKLWIKAEAVDNIEEKWISNNTNEKIFYYNEKENWWSRAWVPDNMPVGEPGWPDSEIFWDFWEEHNFHNIWVKKLEKNWTLKEENKVCHPACDCWRFLEIWNNVFMQFKKTESWFEELENKNIDFGWWLERFVAAINNTSDVFLWDMFDWSRNKLEELSGKKYWENNNETKAFRIILDHLRVATFLIADWALPSNKDQWYFTRRVLRRAIRFAKDLWINLWVCEAISLEVIDYYKEHYTNLKDKQDLIIKEIKAEEEQFLSTLEKWLKEFNKLLRWFEIAFERSGKKITNIAWAKAFKLYDTYWFPIEMTIELAEENNLTVDKEWFNKAFIKHQELSRKWSEQKFKWGLADDSEATTELHSATHLLLSWLNYVLWDWISQKWSNITAERLRFDFNYDTKVDRKKLDKIEEYVNKAITSWLKVEMTEMPKQEAIDSWVKWSFWEKYPDIVKVYTMTWWDWVIYSRELCWWPHVIDSSKMWVFKIQKEQASSRWVRRIKAVLIKD